MTDSKSLHSGEYVRRFEAANLGRVRGLVSRLEFPDDASIADFGCGNGMLLHALGHRRGRYTGIDFSSDFIEAARRWAERGKLSNYQFVESEIVEFCARHLMEFDIATAFDFSEHVETGLAIEIFGAIRSSLRTGGRFYLHTPNLDFIVERAKDIGILEQFPEHIAVRTAGQMKSLLIQSGFQGNHISVEAIPHYNVLKLLHPLTFLPVIGRYFEARLLITAEV